MSPSPYSGQNPELLVIRLDMDENIHDGELRRETGIGERMPFITLRRGPEGTAYSTSVFIGEAPGECDRGSVGGH
jgi:hypothetical protein